MLKIPMQIYLDPETVQVYKDYAKETQQSFAVVVRSILDKEIARLKTQLEKSKSSTSFSEAVEEIANYSKQFKDHHPDLTNDELLYA